MEAMAADMMKNNAELRKQFENKLASDTTFAKNPHARLNFFYEKSPYADGKMNVYPVGKCMSPFHIEVVEEKEK